MPGPPHASAQATSSAKHDHDDPAKHPRQLGTPTECPVYVRMGAWSNSGVPFNFRPSEPVLAPGGGTCTPPPAPADAPPPAPALPLSLFAEWSTLPALDEPLMLLPLGTLLRRRRRPEAARASALAASASVGTRLEWVVGLAFTLPLDDRDSVESPSDSEPNMDTFHTSTVVSWPAVAKYWPS